MGRPQGGGVGPTTDHQQLYWRAGPFHWPRRHAPARFCGPITKGCPAHTMRVIPSNIIDYLSPLVLAIWYMSDGHATEVSVGISTARYTESECD